MNKKQNRINGREALSRVAYYNCLILAPDGTELGYCDEKRERYYLSHALATQIDGYKTKAIKLNFEPKSKDAEKEFLFPRENICVVCGKTENLTKHHIVPYNYRMNFPIEIKSRNSYDIVALCVEHHNEYERKADKFKKELAKELGVEIKKKQSEDKNLFIENRAKCAASSLMLYGEYIPEEKKKKLMIEIETFLGRKPNSSDLTSLRCERIKRKVREPNEHGKLICEKLGGIEKINDFIIRWRQHFLKVMNPQHMPKDWKVDRKFPIRKESHQWNAENSL